MENFGTLLINEINSVRTNPTEYAKKLLSYEKYFNNKTLTVPGENTIETKEGFGAFYEAAHHLSQMFPVLPLKLNTGLVNVAEDALVDLIKIKDTNGANQLNMDFYVEKWGFVVGSFNEAIELGTKSPEHIVAHLLVDDGDLDRGNRKHLMSPNYRFVGFATAPHEVFHQANVITYARTFFGHEEEPQLSEDHKEENKLHNKHSNKEIATTPKVTYQLSKDHEIVTDEGKTTYHTEVEKKEVKKDGYLSYSYSRTSKSNFSSDHSALPEDCLKLDRDEKIITENGKKKKVITIKKTMKDGSVKTEISKNDL